MNTPFAPMPQTQPQAPQPQQPKTPDVAGFINAARARGTPDSQIYSFLQSKGYIGQKQQTQSTPDYTDQVRSAVSAGANKFAEGMNEAAPGQGKDVGNLVEGVGKEIGGAAEAVTSPIAPFMKPVVDAITAAGDKLADTPLMQAYGRDVTLPGNDQTKPTDAERTVGTINNLAEGAGVVAGATGAPEAGEAALNVAKEAGGNLSDLAKAIGTKSPEDVDAAIQKSYTKAVRPSVTGKNTASQVQAYNNNALSAIKSIVNNKANLKITDEFGDPTGELPKNLQQFSQAIEQTKQSIFKQYDAMAKDAGEKGATVPLKPAVDELNKIASDNVTNDLHPDLANYAASKAKVLLARGEYSTEDAQTAVQNFNKSLEAFYKNPTYDTATKASVDALIANKLRSGLDEAISNVSGKGYAGLKNQYGALKAIERDVVKRAIVDARQTGNGLMGSWGDVVSAEDVIRGVMKLNPTEIASGALLKGGLAFLKHLRDPNRAIGRLFELADQTKTTGQPK